MNVGAGVHSPASASPRTAGAFLHIQAVLGTSFVPTVYQKLSAYPDAFHAAVSQVERIVSLAKANDFVSTAQQAARTGLSQQPESVGRVNEGVAEVVGRYREANPLNLLVSMAIVGTTAQPPLPVMDPPLPPASDQIWEDILGSHGSVITPGLWRELAPWPDDLDRLWASVRAAAGAGLISRARAAVIGPAIALLSGSEWTTLAADITDRLPVEGANELAWFPTGIATMVVEGEWLHTLISQPYGGNSNEQA